MGTAFAVESAVNAQKLGAKGNPVIITIDSRFPESAQHINDFPAVVKGKIDRPGTDQRRADNLSSMPTKRGYDRDEVPPAVLDTGGKGVSVRYVSPSDNRGAGASMGQQMRKLPDGTWVKIIGKK